MPSKRNSSKVGAIVAALALASPANASIASDLKTLGNSLRCLGASAYNGPYLTTSTRLIKPAGKTGKFMHISDIHIDEMYLPGTDPATGNMCHRPNLVDPSKNIAGKYGTISSICDTPDVLLNATLSWVKDNTKDIDFIIYTGDSARHDRDTKNPRTHAEVMNEHKMVIDRLATVFDFKKVKFIPTFGNNDGLDYNKLANVSDPLIATLTQYWEPLGLGLSTNQDWLTGGYFHYDLSPQLTVLNLNSMQMFKSNTLVKDCVGNNSGNQMLDWFEAKLLAYRKTGRKAYVMQHIPPLDIKGTKLFYEQCHQRYIKLMGMYSDVILGSFYGHTNQDYISYIYTNNTAKPQDGPFFIETVTDQPPKTDFDNTCVLHINHQGPAIIPENNPGIRVYSYDTSKAAYGGLVGYRQYWADIVKANAQDKVVYESEYTTSGAYGLWNLSPLSWTGALKNWATNSTAFRDYVKYRYVQNPSPLAK